MKNSKGRQLQQVSFTVLAQWMHLIGRTYKNKPQQSNTRIVQNKNLKDCLIRAFRRRKQSALTPCLKCPDQNNVKKTKHNPRCDGGVDAAASNYNINNSNDNHVTLEMAGDRM